MTIQHRDLPNSELHEVKGASSASAGSVLVSNGVGGTVFSKLGVNNFTGSVPDSVPDLVLSTDGEGGFKVRQQALGLFRVQGFTTGPQVVTEATPIGFYLVDGGFKVSQTGYYLFLFNDSVAVVNPVPDTYTTIPAAPLIKNQFGNAVFQGISGAVYLNMTDTFYIGNLNVPEGPNARFSVVRYDL